MCYIHNFHCWVVKTTNAVNFLNNGWNIIVSWNFLTSSNTPLLLETVHYLRKSALLWNIVHCIRIFTIYCTLPNQFLEDTPNQILHMLTTLILWSTIFFTTIWQYPTLYDFLAITPEDISCWEYYLTYPNKCTKLNIFQPTVLTTPLYEWTPSVDPPKSGEELHHMHGSDDVFICHTVSTMTSLSVCQSHDSFICQPKHDSMHDSSVILSVP